MKVSDKTIGARLAGVIRKTLEITASDTEPLKWINAENGNILIETLKRYMKSAEGRYKIWYSRLKKSAILYLMRGLCWILKKL